MVLCTGQPTEITQSLLLVHQGAEFPNIFVTSLIESELSEPQEDFMTPYTPMAKQTHKTTLNVMTEN